MLIKIKNLNFYVKHQAVLHNINLEIVKNRSLSIIGKSGAGKSLLLRNIIGILTPTSGKIEYMGIDLNNINYTKRSSFLERTGFLFQNGGLFDSLTVEENIMFFLKNNKNLSSKLNVNFDILEILNWVGLNHNVLELYPSELSGGMYKRVALARAIAHKPQILFLDEPTTGLDPVMSYAITKLVLDLKKNLGITVISVTHDIKMSTIISEEIIFISEGKILWHGNKEDLGFTNLPEIEEFLKLSK